MVTPRASGQFLQDGVVADFVADKPDVVAQAADFGSDLVDNGNRYIGPAIGIGGGVDVHAAVAKNALLRAPAHVAVHIGVGMLFQVVFKLLENRFVQHEHQ